MKRIFFLALLLVLTGCANKPITGYKNVQDKLMAMESYISDVDITYVNNKGQDKCKTTQYAINDGKYRIEIAEPIEQKGNVILFDGKMVWSYNPSVEQKVQVNAPDKPERYELILFSFIENYVKSQNVTVESANFDESLCTVLEAEIPDDNKFLATEKLWIDNESMMPVRLVIYDDEGKERIIAQFSNFQYNCQIEQSKFTLEE